MMATSTLRKLLRAVHRHVRPQGSSSAQPHFRDYVLAEFRKNVGLTDAAVIKQKLSLAEDCATLITSVHYHKVKKRQFVSGPRAAPPHRLWKAFLVF